MLCTISNNCQHGSAFFKLPNWKLFFIWSIFHCIFWRCSNKKTSCRPPTNYSIEREQQIIRKPCSHQDSNWVPYQRISKYFCNAARLQLTDQDLEAKDKVCGARGPEFHPSFSNVFSLSSWVQGWRTESNTIKFAWSSVSHWGPIIRKQIARWLYLSRMKNDLHC